MDNNNSAFDFTVDKARKKAFINMEFAAEQAVVWDAFTIPEILDQWYAPLPWKSKTKHMNFVPGGRRFYAMVSPEGVEHWAVQKFLSINPKSYFKMYNCFADKDENLQLPGSEWDINFSQHLNSDLNSSTTKVNIEIYNESLERMERMIEMGFKEGMAMQIENLKKLLPELMKGK